ncbi:MAG: M23 family metallopeptidase [Phenylobacterium sp.]|jgi:murein DD-endopeptidase MepM/ murein hydrolase activator NlpD|uniref:M23 family metallopeptidase n=1 Tax=Phenylobacterium sp. TaxID=1871053 RepID=UPI002A35CABE|nr:M23 family metallopeptidase [Phenylobacterium sp.]MDX9996881.1 M23 family metallopeptidase [Phenylobacterium sp.]
MQEFDPRRPTFRFAPAAAGVGALAVALLAWKLTSPQDLGPAAPPPLDPAAIAALQHQAFAAAEAQPGFARPESVEVKVRPGETFEAAVRRAGVAPEEARQAVQTLGGAMDVVNIKAGMKFDAAVAKPESEQGPARLIGLSLRTGPARAITLSRSFDGALRLRALEEEVREELTVADGEIQGSLYQSAAKQGATPQITGQMVKLFSHKVDFREIQPGDPFVLVFGRKVTESGRTVETGELEYAELKGQRFYRFERPGGGVEFFDENGKNIKGFLLRTPIDGARMTSRFGMRRHPISGYNRMHQGIDFGAGTGTPVYAAGDGVLVEARRWGGYGNWVRVRHSNGWETGYAHLSRFAKGLKPGQRVRQGQVIAYVGSTGASTGPHLHYEVWKNGSRINPVGAKVPQGTVLAGAELAAFKAKKAQIERLVAAKAETRHLAQGPSASLTKASLQR